MNLFFRGLLVIIAILFVVASVFTIIVTLNESLFNGIIQSLVYWLRINNTARLIVLVISFIFLVLGIVLFIAGLGGRKDRKAISKYTNVGEVKISLSSIEEIALTAVGKFSGMKNARAFVAENDDNVTITIKGMVLPDVNIPVLSSEVQQAVKNTVEEVSGLTVSDVKIYIEGIYSNSLPNNKVRNE